MNLETKRVANSIKNHLPGLGDGVVTATALLHVTIEWLKPIHPSLAAAIALLTHIQPHELELEVQRLRAIAKGDEHFTGGDAA